MQHDTATDTKRSLESVCQLGSRLREALAGSIVGQEDVVDDLIVCLLAEGHCLLEGLPGLAKTEIVKSLAAAINLDFGRIQFTPDILPADIVGSDVLVDHPTDGRQVARNLNDDVLHAQPETIEARAKIAEVCTLKLDMQMPMLLDNMSNEVDTLYAGLPERLYVLNSDGVVEFRTVVGSPGFDVEAWEAAVNRAV